VLHAIDEAARAVLALPERPDTVGVLATTGCLVAGMFQASLERFGLKCVIPDDGAQESEVMEAIYGQKGIKAGHTDSRNRRLLVGVAETLVAGGAGAIIGGCTEVPLVVGAGDLEVPFIDTLDVLARAAVRYCRGS
jgi:aspartate racemase